MKRTQNLRHDRQWETRDGLIINNFLTLERLLGVNERRKYINSINSQLTQWNAVHPFLCVTRKVFGITNPMMYLQSQSLISNNVFWAYCFINSLAKYQHKYLFDMKWLPGNVPRVLHVDSDSLPPSATWNSSKWKMFFDWVSVTNAGKDTHNCSTAFNPRLPRFNFRKRRTSFFCKRRCLDFISDETCKTTQIRAKDK